MFTGIVSDIGTIRGVERRGDLRVEIATGYDTATIDLGASIACSGVCLTVVDLGPDWFAVDVSRETESRSAPHWSEGQRLNLERALKLGDELGGHIVTGHVDGVGEVTAAEDVGGSRRLTISAPRELAGHVAAKGSITLDGVSLTVNEVTDDPDSGTRFTVNVIPHTAEVTTLAVLVPGDTVNLEIDVLSRYLQRMLSHSNVISA